MAPVLFLRHLFSTDHKVIGLLYGFTSLFFLLVGFVLVVIMRWQLAYPGQRGSLPRSTTASARCTAPSWCSSASCRWRSARSATTSCRCKSARPTWPSRGSTWRAGGSTPSAASSCWPASSRPGGAADVRLDVVRAARRLRPVRTDLLAVRHAVPDLLVAAGGAELHHHDRAAARAWPDLVPPAVLRLGPVHHRVPAAAGVSSAAGSRGAAGHGPPRRHQLLPAERAGGQRRARRRSPATATC